MKDNSPKARLRKSARVLGEIEPRSELQIAIIKSLLDGPRTIAELSREILGEEPRGCQAQSNSAIGELPIRLRPYSF